MPVNPNTAATNAITKKITAQRNIFSPPPKIIRTIQLLRVHLNGLRGDATFQVLDEIWNVVETIGNEDAVLGDAFYPLNTGLTKSGKTGFRCGERTEKPSVSD